MKIVKIKYNPYMVTTEITIDGIPPKNNSSLCIGEGHRIQEWIDRLPQYLMDEYRDQNFEIWFTGTRVDYEDVIQSFEPFHEIYIDPHLEEKDDIDKVEKEINHIFEEIQNGPLEELKDEVIRVNFEKAKDSRFEIDVVATMSSGKSTLINALFKRKLLPASSGATTATIVRI
ncbi:MAG: dynamin family protein, partial [Prevotella sp.]|nr:dynamin family protein [Prevotella sp.]